MAETESTALAEAELRATFARIIEHCNAVMETASQHLAIARESLAAVDRVDELKAVADRLGIHTGPLGDLRTRLAELMK